MFSSSSTDQQQLEAGEAEVAATEELFVEDEDQPFLWEQISGSIDAVELEEVQRVIGLSLVNACADIYAEVRALREIHRDYAAATDDLVKSSASLPRATSSAPAGLVQLELKSLVGQLRKRAAASGAHEDALLPVPSSPHRTALESVLREEVDGGGGGDERARTQHIRPDTADSERLSLRKMRLGGGGSRPSTASIEGGGSRPPTSSAGSRPVTASTSNPMQMQPQQPQQPPKSPKAARGGGSSRPASSAGGGRPASARSSVGSDGGGSFVSSSAMSEGGSTSRPRSARPSRSGMVVSRLRAALEEERQALLGQAEALRLAIDDEHDYRGRVARPAPSLTSLLELKKALQSVLSATDNSAALKAEEKGASHKRGELSAYAPLPEVGAKK